jgi:hypothetical protein
VQDYACGVDDPAQAGLGLPPDPGGDLAGEVVQGRQPGRRAGAGA